LPNVVAWSDKPQIPITSAPVVLTAETSRIGPKLNEAVVAPPPEVLALAQPSRRNRPDTRQLAVIAPPPQVHSETSRLSDLDIAHSAVIAPAPQLSLDEQHTSSTAAHFGAQLVRIIAPPPSTDARIERGSGQNMIALSLRPSVTPPAEAVAGNRRGSFGLSPEGHHGSRRAEASSSSVPGKGAATKLAASSDDLPDGLYVGKAANASPVNPNLIADARPSRASARPLRPDNSTDLSEEERSVFRGRRFYSLNLNMPNLNSAGGSWIIRFATVNGSAAEDSNGLASASQGAATTSANDLSAPSATRKVDPAYPLELMRQNLGGTVILYAVIRSDGTVGNIRVLRSVDERLDRYASQAIAKWHFEPARKNGSPVDVEATFWIPFRPANTDF